METAKALFKYLLENQWLYLAYAVPVFIVIAWFYFKNKEIIFSGFKDFINWIRPSFETGGYASPEKITASVIITFAYIPASLIFMLQASDPLHKLYALGVHATFILVLFRIITPQQLAELKNGISPSKPNTPDVPTEKPQ